MREAAFREALAKLSRKTGIAVGAFSLVLEALKCTMHARGGCLSQPVHLPPRAVLEGFRVHMRTAYGPLARAVLDSLGIASTEDVGRALIALATVRLVTLRRRETIRQFQGVFSFDAAFGPV